MLKHPKLRYGKHLIYFAFRKLTDGKVKIENFEGFESINDSDVPNITLEFENFELVFAEFRSTDPTPMDPGYKLMQIYRPSSENFRFELKNGSVEIAESEDVTFVVIAKFDENSIYQSSYTTNNDDIK